MTRPAWKRIAQLASDAMMRSLGHGILASEAYASPAAAAAFVREFARCMRQADRHVLDLSEVAAMFSALADDIEDGHVDARPYASACLRIGKRGLR